MKLNRKYIGGVIAFVLLSLMGSCGKKSADISDLLATVPADASSVIAVNVAEMLKKLDCKIDGSVVTPGKELEGIISKSADKKELTMLFNGEYSISPTGVVIFIEGREHYLTGYLDNSSKFKSAVEKHKGEKFTTADGVDICGNIGVRGEQFWIRTSHRNMIESSEIIRFISLSDKLSYLSSNYSEKLIGLEHDITGIGNIAGLLNVSGMSFSNRSMMRMVIETLYSGAEEIEFSADFEKGKVVSHASLLTGKGTPAKFLFPTERINPAVMKEAGGKADVVMGGAFSSEMLTELSREIGKKGISMLQVMLQTMTSVDGTCGLLMGTGDSLSGFFSVKKEGSAPLSEMLTEADFKVSRDGNLLRYSRGVVNGHLDVTEVADNFKGAVMGLIIAAGSEFMPVDEFKGAEYLSMMLLPEEGTVLMHTELAGKDKKKNILFSLIK